MELKKKILVTGAAGFIGFHVSLMLVNQGHEATGIDNLNSYYDVELKEMRLRELGICIDNRPKKIPYKSDGFQNFTFLKGDITDNNFLHHVFFMGDFDTVVHLAAQAGVRYSIENPEAYIESNITGFFNVIDCSRQFEVDRFIYASSSSVYGKSSVIPYNTNDRADSPVSLYAATKRSNELIAHSYSHIYGIQTIGLRFFTVYGTYGRPDMAPFIFAEKILRGEEISVYNHGQMKRDFTHVSDVVESISILSQKQDIKEKYLVLNIGRGEPVNILDFIWLLESFLCRNAKIEFCDIQPGDVLNTWADSQPLFDLCGFSPKVDIATGVKEFSEWFRDYFEKILTRAQKHK